MSGGGGCCGRPSHSVGSGSLQTEVSYKASGNVSIILRRYCTCKVLLYAVCIGHFVVVDFSLFLCCETFVAICVKSNFEATTITMKKHSNSKHQ